MSAKPSIKRPIILSMSFALWLAGALILVTKAAMNGVRLRRLRAGARRVSLADLDCDECDCEALRTGKVSLALSDDIRSPILLGVLRPMIVFPADIADWTSPMERSAMLRHELAHVERRDHYVNLFQTILGAVFFFHPLARYACRQLTLEERWPAMITCRLGRRGRDLRREHHQSSRAQHYAGWRATRRTPARALFRQTNSRKEDRDDFE